MPTSMQLSASSMTPPASLTAALSLHILPIQLSPAAVSSLYAIGIALHTSAALPGQQVESDEHAKFFHECSGIDHAQTRAAAAASLHTTPQAVPHRPGHVTSEEFSSQPTAAGAGAVHDDLRCGLFSMASVPASRPGGPCICP